VSASFQKALASVDPGLPLYGMQPLTGALKAQTSTARFGSMLLTVFSAGTVLLAAVGLYGLIATSPAAAAARSPSGLRWAPTRVAWRRSSSATEWSSSSPALRSAWLERWAPSACWKRSSFNRAALDVRTEATVALLLIVIALLASALSTRRAVASSEGQILFLHV
jgi:hypothetical protein